MFKRLLSRFLQAKQVLPQEKPEYVLDIEYEIHRLKSWEGRIKARERELKRRKPKRSRKL